MKVTVIGEQISPEEQEVYVRYLLTKYPNRKLTDLEITVRDNEVDLRYHYERTPFERIRRITGYLAGTLDRFNNAKKSEVQDRLKHDVSQGMERI